MRTRGTPGEIEGTRGNAGENRGNEEPSVPCSYFCFPSFLCVELVGTRGNAGGTRGNAVPVRKFRIYYSSINWRTGTMHWCLADIKPMFVRT